MTYDIESNLLTISDVDSSYTYTYDGRQRLSTSSNSGTSGAPTVELSLAYDRTNARTQLATNVAGTDDFVNDSNYDALGRMSRIDQDDVTGGTSLQEKRVDFTYGNIGMMSDMDRYESLTTSNLVAHTDLIYDNFGRLTDQTHKKGMTTLGSYGVTFDSDRRVDSMTTPDGTGDFTYDDSGQLTAADYDFQTDESFSYDLTGNRTMTGYSTGDNNQLLSDGTHNYNYDKEGNRSRKTTISTGDYIDYEWDHRNRMTKVTFRDSMDAKTKEVFYTYDVFDRRIEKQLDSNGNGTIDTTEVFVYDAGAKDGLEDILFIFDASSNLLHRYLHGPGIDQPLADESSSSLYWLLPGHLGTICDVVDYASVTDTTSVVNHLTYTSFGEIATETDASKTPLYGFTGREWDADVVLGLYRHRWYQSSAGRFISEDILGIDPRPNTQTRVFVTQYRDPNGLDVWVEFSSGFYGFHQRICVSVWSVDCKTIEGQYCAGFGGTSVSGSCGCGGDIMPDNDDRSLRVVKTEESTCKEDAVILEFLKRSTGEADGVSSNRPSGDIAYWLFLHDCQDYADNTFKHIVFNMLQRDSYEECVIACQKACARRRRRRPGRGNGSRACPCAMNCSYGTRFAPRRRRGRH